MSRLLTLIGFCVALGASAVPAGAFQLHYGPVFGSHRSEFRGGERRRHDQDRTVIVIERGGHGGRGETWRPWDRDVRIIERRGDRFGHDRREHRGHRGGGYARHGGFRGYPLSPRHRLWTR